MDVCMRIEKGTRRDGSGREGKGKESKRGKVKGGGGMKLLNYEILATLLVHVLREVCCLVAAPLSDISIQSLCTCLIVYVFKKCGLGAEKFNGIDVEIVEFCSLRWHTVRSLRSPSRRGFDDS